MDTQGALFEERNRWREAAKALARWVAHHGPRDVALRGIMEFHNRAAGHDRAAQAGDVPGPHAHRLLAGAYREAARLLAEELGVEEASHA
jgi:hypothetical protein